MPPETRDVCVVGGGVAGLTAATFTARGGLDTLVLDGGEPILARNAHLENVPGFPVGVDARRFLALLREGADRNGVDRREARVVDLESPTAEDLLLTTGGGEEVRAESVVAASWSDATYLEDVDGVGLIDRGSKTFVDVDGDGATGVPGLYAAGRLAERRHQTVVAAGDGANVGLAILEDADVPFYHDWVVPEGYFTGRGRDVPPGCAEIDDEERRHRTAESRAVMRDRFAEPYPGEPTQHPSVSED